jgi:hypothetical protein
VCAGCELGVGENLEQSLAILSLKKSRNDEAMMVEDRKFGRTG